MRFNTVPWMSWSPTGDRLAYFVAPREVAHADPAERAQPANVEQRIEHADGRRSRVARHLARRAERGVRGAAGRRRRHLRRRPADAARSPTSPRTASPTPGRPGRRTAGRSSTSRASAATKSCSGSTWPTGQKTQLTFGTHDDSAAQFLDADTLVFSSTATDPAQPIEPEVARNGNIYNIWTLSLKNGELRQYTDALGGNTSAVVLPSGGANPRIAFVSYYKGEYELHVLDRREPIVTAASADFGAPGPIIDFQAPLSHTLIAENKRTKGTFEKLFLDGRPPVNVGVTSGGDVFGGSAVTFSDVLGDKQFNLYAASISQYRTLSFSYLNIVAPVQLRGPGLLADAVLLRSARRRLLRPAVWPASSTATSPWRRGRVRGGSAFGIWPLNRYRRLELFGGVLQYKRGVQRPDAAAVLGRSTSRSSSAGSCSGPAPTSRSASTSSRRRRSSASSGRWPATRCGSSYEVAPKIGNTLSRQTADVDARYYLRLGGSGLLALRARGFKSWGDAPDFMYFGGNSEMRGYEYLEFLGSEGGVPERRAPLPVHRGHADAARRPRRHPRRALRQHGRREASRASRSSGGRTAPRRTIADVGLTVNRSRSQVTPVSGRRATSTASGWSTRAPRTASASKRSRSASPSTSTGRGGRSSTRTGKTRCSPPLRRRQDRENCGGSSSFRKPQFAMWIGYDF